MILDGDRELREVEAALAEFDSLGSDPPDSADLWLCWGTCLRRLGRGDEGIANLRRPGVLTRVGAGRRSCYDRNLILFASIT